MIYNLPHFQTFDQWVLLPIIPYELAIGVGARLCSGLSKLRGALHAFRLIDFRWGDMK